MSSPNKYKPDRVVNVYMGRTSIRKALYVGVSRMVLLYFESLLVKTPPGRTSTPPELKFNGLQL